MRARIHRGAAEVGGNCLELEAGGRHLLLDLGRPLWADPQEHVPLPDVPGLLTGDDELVGIVLSHGHPDHYGLVNQISSDVPVYVGEATTKILREAAFFTPSEGLDAFGYLHDQETLELGPFRVTPYLVDHSAFDAFALLVEADGKRLFYSGDLRAHGRKPGTFERLVRDPPKDIDVFVLEGTRLSRDESGFGEPASEPAVERALIESFRATDGMVLALYSPQNVDRYVSIYRAALRSDRDLVIDLYTAAIAAATGLDSIPQASWERIRVFLPGSQKTKIVRAKAFERVNAVHGSRIYAAELKDRRGELVMTFRASMAADLERADCLKGASAVWSMWRGYLDNPSGRRLGSFLARHGIPLEVIHASGHATGGDLQRLATAVAADTVVPIHTDTPERFADLFANVVLRPDGTWWKV